jgi:transcriptional regulator with XRE-family HTH domain
MRHERGSKSQEALAAAADVHRTYIGCLERGEREPGLLMLLILAKALDVSLDWLAQSLPVPVERRPQPRRKGTGRTSANNSS